MNFSSIKAFLPDRAGSRALSAKPWFYPAALLLIGLLAHGTALAALGFYWDDWEVVLLLWTRNPSLLYGYFAFDRPFAWPYQLTGALVGLAPLGWHVASLLLRWGGVLLMYFSLRRLWPRFDTHWRWLAALWLVYPGFFQQSASTAFNRHFMAFFLYSLSIYLMLRAVGDRKSGRFLWPLSWAAAVLQLFTMEYFVGLELVRPIFLWLGFRAREKREPQPVKETLLFSLPYALILGAYFWWRLIVFPSTLSTNEYAADVKMFGDFQGPIIGGVLALVTRVFLDLIYLIFGVWSQGIAGFDGFTFQGKIAWFAFAAGTFCALFLAFFQSPPGKRDAVPRSVLPIFVLGFSAFFFSSLPVWLATKQLSSGGRFDDRFTLAPMVGAGLMVIALLVWLVRPHRQSLVLSLLLVFSIATQILTVNKYRLDWSVQREYYWQLYWRAPALKPGTAFFSFEQPSPLMPAYDASYALNVLYHARISGGQLPYWFFTNNRFLNFEFEPGHPIKYILRNLKFTGNTSDGLSIVHQTSLACLRVLDAVYADDPLYTGGQGSLIAVSNLDRILPEANAAVPDPDIFGPEPPHTWCYFFQKADLARQQQDWPAVIALQQQADREGLSPQAGAEYLPAIEALARTGEWQSAYQLSLSAQRLTPGLQPMLCRNWLRFGHFTNPDPEALLSAGVSFGCNPNP